MMNCVNIWQICITQWMNSFQITNALCYKILHRSKNMLKYKADQWILNVTKYEKFIYMIDMVSKFTLKVNL